MFRDFLVREIIVAPVHLSVTQEVIFMWNRVSRNRLWSKNIILSISSDRCPKQVLTASMSSVLLLSHAATKIYDDEIHHLYQAKNQEINFAFLTTRQLNLAINQFVLSFTNSIFHDIHRECQFNQLFQDYLFLLILECIHGRFTVLHQSQFSRDSNSWLVTTNPFPTS